ncbi:hypothetical protein GIY23_05975 [Allosaccharopolyspora coralli]|uniref:Uncharacterized protein n=1 Tax=Allosaccharopolyspora coralli TaxID=2665642 RepID=A0A5Q3Q497_9PSEU|nr:hypothetical protein [Allosaccharopolyspora coralli]QGK69143.1 hypothetical protein GIY23_05975 [Allosaccharopolyspora coralli]
MVRPSLKSHVRLYELSKVEVEYQAGGASVALTRRQRAAAAVSSDGYQGLWLDTSIFHGDLAPPEPDRVKYKR